jgi:adenylosuccinate lyase
MTKERALSLSDLLWKIVVPIFLALASFSLNRAAGELSDLKADIKAMREEYQAKLESLSIQLAVLQNRVDHIESVKQ